MHGKSRECIKNLAEGATVMYKKEEGQITIAEFISPFGQLDKNNRWVRMADLIPWQHYEKKYAEQFCDNNGAPAIKFRMAMGTLMIKQKTGHSDDEVLQDIMENPYMQYLIGLYEFTTTAPFAQSSITNFRKYITPEMICEINKECFKLQIAIMTRRMIKTMTTMIVVLERWIPKRKKNRFPIVAA